MRKLAQKSREGKEIAIRYLIDREISIERTVRRIKRRVLRKEPCETPWRRGRNQTNNTHLTVESRD